MLFLEAIWCCLSFIYFMHCLACLCVFFVHCLLSCGMVWCTAFDPRHKKKRSLQNDSNLYKWLRIPDSVLSRGKDMKHMFLDGAACCRSVVWYSVPCLYCVKKWRSLETTQNPCCKCLYIIKVYYCTLTAVVVCCGADRCRRVAWCGVLYHVWPAAGHTNDASKMVMCY